MEVLSMTYIADSIGNDYKNWGAGQIVFISAPTGSGKTTFIFKKILPAWGGKGKVLYLVNRKILKEQLKERMRGVVTDQGYPLSVMIDIKTYQEVEQEARELVWNPAVNMYITEEAGGFWNSYKNYTSYGCVICDECHYFLMDSNYNTNTIYSYKVIRDLFKDKLRIFMSATIEEIQEQIEKDFRQTTAIQSDWLNLQRQVANPVSPRYSDKWKYYSLDVNYDYLDIHIIKNTDEIPKLIMEDNNKWLIFVDSITKGHELRKKILADIDKENKSNKDDVLFISAGYILDPESKKEVEEIIHHNKQSARILIATSVLDNGINLEDVELRNLVILADSKTEFIQMLGRKRKDGNKVKVYVCGRSKAHFIRRQNNHNKQLDIALDCIGRIWKSWFPVVNDSRYSDQQKQNKESELILYEHQILMKNIMDRYVRMGDVQATFVERAGVLHLNRLSLQNLMNLNKFYEKIIARFELEGEDAFLREQLEWLEINSDEINQIIQESKTNRLDKSLKIVINAFEAHVNKTMSYVESLDFKNSIKTELMVLCKEIRDENKKATLEDVLTKKGHALTKPNIETLRNEFGFPYKMDVKKGTYTIQKIEDK